MLTVLRQGSGLSKHYARPLSRSGKRTLTTSVRVCRQDDTAGSRKVTGGAGGVIAESDFQWYLNANDVRSANNQTRKLEDLGGAQNAKAKRKPKPKTKPTTEVTDDETIDFSRANELGPKGQSWPPLAKDVLINMARFPTCIVLTRVGGFYEAYFDQAPVLANLLRIKLATRTWGGRTIGMAGFPIFQLEKYLKRLVIDHRKLVAICDEFKEITSADGSVRLSGGGANNGRENPFAPSMARSMLNEKVEIRRKVTRVVSPGTLIDESFLDPFASNWVLSICRIGSQYGLAWMDVSTADFNTTICDDAQSMRDEVARIGPIEIVVEPGEFTQERPEGSAVVSADDVDRAEQPSYIIKEGPLWEALDPNKVHVSFLSRQEVIASPNGGVKSPEDYAVANLTAHLRTRLLDFDITDVKDLTGTNEGPVRRRRDSVMTIDASTLSALEINTAQRREEATFNALSNTLSIKGSLLSYVRRTVTKGGARLLAQWLTSPSTSLPLIQRRQSLVALFHAQPFMCEDLRTALKRRAGDINRALQRILTSRNDEQDLLEVRDFTKLCRDIVEQLRREVEIAMREKPETGAQANADGWDALSKTVDAFENLIALGDRLGEAIDESVIDKRLREQEDRMRDMELEVMGEAAAKISEERAVAARKKRMQASISASNSGMWGMPFEHLIRPSTSEALSALTKEHITLRKRAGKLEEDLQSRFSDRISLRFLLGQGYVVHVNDVAKSAAALAEMEKEMQMAYRSKSTRTYYHEQWTRIGSRLSKVEQELQEKEAVELQKLRLEVLIEMGRLRKNAALVHELDCLAGFGTLASELKLSRPEVNDGQVLKIEQGRHLGVEMSLIQQHEQKQQWAAATLGECFVASTAEARPFTPNDVYMDGESRLHMITGPNMGGKSTLLRMVAIITILAQVGSFVPAKSCTVGVIDQIFSRIGAHDAIHADRSTFMVEMLEVAQFLRRSTARSLVLCDEVGRGTDSATGTAIAHATALQLVDTIKCKCLFATHLHTVADLLTDVKGVEYFCTNLEQTSEGEILFSHKLEPGLNRHSHGLTIARLAGMPDEVLSRARETMNKLDEGQASSISVVA